MFLNYDPTSEEHPNFTSDNLEEVNNLHEFLNKLNVSCLRTKIGKDNWVLVVSLPEESTTNNNDSVDESEEIITSSKPARIESEGEVEGEDTTKKKKKKKDKDVANLV